ncbi:MAG: hypothetical protein C5B49_04225 [Bdellovibrio sp.]|nr:MAG: hypothetical protein C5B49_04225 [Bdellovibrio sp.]
MANTKVLIVGAGPTGLTAANELARLGVQVKIIDKTSVRSEKSRAIGVHAGTLESLENSFGKDFCRKLIGAGHKVRTAFLHVYSKAPIRVDLGVIPSVYNFVLILPQSKTEQLLEEELNKSSIYVDRNTEWASLREVDGKVLSILRDRQGHQTEVTSDFVIGADGAHSAIRNALHLPFRGDAYKLEFIQGDVEIEWPWPYGDIRSFLSSKGFLACFPLSSNGSGNGSGKRKGNGDYRLVMVQPNKADSRATKVSLNDFAAAVKSICPEIRIKRETWLSRYSVHHRITNRLRCGRVFLAGDAAHVHSPIGGQGMNTGMQEALNLSFKLATVICKEAPLSLLEHYESECLPVAKDILRATDLATRFGLASNHRINDFAKSFVVPLMAKNKWIRQAVIKGISRVSIARKEIDNRSREKP